MGGPRKAPPLPNAKRSARASTRTSKKAVPQVDGLSTPWSEFLEAEAVRSVVHTGTAARYAKAFGVSRLESPTSGLEHGSLGITPVEPSIDEKASKLASATERKVAAKLGHVFELGRRTAWKLRWADAPATFKAMRATKDGSVSRVTDYPVTELAESASRSGTPAGVETWIRPSTSGHAAQLMCIYIFDHATGDKHPLLISMSASLTDVKSKAASALGIVAPLGSMCMCIGGRRLSDHRKLLSYGIRHGDCLHLMMRRGLNNRALLAGSSTDRGGDSIHPARSHSHWLDGSWDSFGLEGAGSRQPLESQMSGFDEEASTSSCSGAVMQSPCRRLLVRCRNLPLLNLPAELDLTVPWCATITEVKRRIEEEIGVPLAQQRLSFLGRALANDITILDCGATTEVIPLQLEHAAPGMELPPNHYVRNARLAPKAAPGVDKVGMQVTVNETWPGGQCYRVHLADGTGLSRLKERLERWTGLAPHMQILLHRGRVLQADHSTSFYNIKPGDRLELACVGGFVQGLNAPVCS